MIMNGTPHLDHLDCAGISIAVYAYRAQVLRERSDQTQTAKGLPRRTSLIPETLGLFHIMKKIQTLLSTATPAQFGVGAYRLFVSRLRLTPPSALGKLRSLTITQKALLRARFIIHKNNEVSKIAGLAAWTMVSVSFFQHGKW